MVDGAYALLFSDEFGCCKFGCDFLSNAFLHAGGGFIVGLQSLLPHLQLREQAEAFAKASSRTMNLLLQIGQ